MEEWKGYFWSNNYPKLILNGNIEALVESNLKDDENFAIYYKFTYNGLYHYGSSCEGKCDVIHKKFEIKPNRSQLLTFEINARNPSEIKGIYKCNHPIDDGQFKLTKT